MIRTIEEMDSFFNKYTPNFGNGNLRENRLERMEILLSTIGNPERYFTSYHIAGSKGKGTTASYLSTLIDRNVEKCALYMSPHVYDVRERFTNATHPFSDKEYLDSINELEEKIKRISFPKELGPSTPTTFELYTAYAYLLFKNSGCKSAVIETGLGGRLDATNTLKNPKAVIFTEIELEHTNVLGNTYEEIANEKLGIVKKNASVFYYQERLKAELEKREIEAIHIDCTPDMTKLSQNSDKNTYSYELSKDETIEINQCTKSSVMDAIFAYRISKNLGLIDAKIINLTDVSIPARFEYVPLKHRNIGAIFEGAHTEISCKYAFESYIKYIRDNKKEAGSLIFSLADGKRVDAICKEVFPFFSSIVITSLGHDKKSKPEEILEIAKKYVKEDCKLVLETNPSKAAALAISATPDNSIIFILGSFYLASEMKKALKELGYVN